MFNYEKIIGIENEKGIIVDLRDAKNLILLTPDTINDIIIKINSLTYGGKVSYNLARRPVIADFVNGYSREFGLPSTYMTRKGKIIDVPGIIKDDFSCDRAPIVLYPKQKGEETTLGYVCGSSGRIIELENAIKLKTFTENIAPVQFSNPKGDYWTYINLRGEIVTDLKFKNASCFIDGKAVVQNMNGLWQLVTKNFEVIYTSNSSNPDDCRDKNEKYISVASKVFQKDNINIEYIGNKVSIIDLDLGLSLKVYEIMNSIIRQLDLIITSSDTFERFTDVITKAFQKGCYVYDLNTHKLSKVKVYNGIKIIDVTGKSVSVFKPEDCLLIKRRLMSGL